jgi:hypothetical protein
VSGIEWFALLRPDYQRRLRDLAQADAVRTPLTTPALEAWHQHGCRVGGPVWAAACWEASALEATAPSSRARSLMISRAIIAVAKGEVTVSRQAVA